jgi:malate synthase
MQATVLIETLPAACYMRELPFEPGEHSLGLHAGRWDYIFSMLKSFRMVQSLSSRIAPR